MANLKISISTPITTKDVVVILPKISGLNVPLIPAKTVESNMYVMSDIIGMYMSGELRSSRGGRYMLEYCREAPGPSAPGPEFNLACCLVHGLCLHGNSTSSSFRTTYEFETLK